MTYRLLIAVLVCAAATVQAQTSAEDARAGEVFHKAPLTSVLKILERKYNTHIAYDHVRVQTIVVDLHVTGTTLPACLEQVLTGTPLTFQHVGSNVIIIPRPTEAMKAATATRFTLTGRVVDADTEETLPQATLTLRGTALATTTNNDGHFTLSNIPADTLVLDVRYLGYLTQTIRIQDILPATSVRIRLRSDTRILNEVVVLDEYNQAIHTEPQPGTAVFNPRAVSTLPSLGEQDMSRTLQLMPGITATDESAAGSVIRGAHPSYNLTLLDGMTIYQQDHFFGAFSIVNADIIKDIHIHKGMFDARYGGRVSGVIDITTKNGNAVKPAFDFKANAINLKAMVELPIARKWSLFVAGRRSFTDVAQSYLFKTLFDIARTANEQFGVLNLAPGTGQQPRPSYYFFDTNAKVSFRPTDRDVVSLSLYVSRDNMRTKETATLYSDSDTTFWQNDNQTRWGNNGVSLRWARQWRDNYYSNVRVSSSRFFRRDDYTQHILLGTQSYQYGADIENNIDDVSYTFDNEWTVAPAWAITWGIASTQQATSFTARDKITPADSTIENLNASQREHSWQHAVYAGATVTPTERWTLTAGGRVVYYNNQQTQLRLEPRATTRYTLNEQWSVKSGYGRASQYVTQRFSPTHTDTVAGLQENYWILSRPDDMAYPVVTSDHVSAGATWKRTQFAYDAEVYYKVTRGVIIDDNLNAGNTRAYGLEVIAQKVRGIHTGWIAYTLSHVTQSNPYILEGRTAPAWQDQRHEVKVVDMVALGRWNLASTVVYGSGKPAPTYNVRYIRDSDNQITDYALLLDYRNQHRLPAYFRLDLSASYRLQWKRSRVLEMGLALHNITDHTNIKSRLVDKAPQEKAKQTNTEAPVTYRNLVLLGFSPSLFLHVSF